MQGPPFRFGPHVGHKLRPVGSLCRLSTHAHRVAQVSASVLSAALASGSEPSVAWPQFRGPAGAGILSAGKLPTSWSTKDNVAWSVEVKGRGWSSPVAWNNTGLRHVGDQSGRVQGAVRPAFSATTTSPSWRSRVCPTTKSSSGWSSRDIELTSESGDIRYMVYAFDAATGKLRVGARSAQGRAVRRPASQEHLRVRNAGDRRRAALRLLRQRRPVRLLARRQAAVDDDVRSAADVSRLRHRRLAGRARRPRLRASTTTTASRSPPRSTRRPASSSGKSIAICRRAARRQAGRRRSSGSTHQRTELVVIGRTHAVVVRARHRQGAVADARAHRPVDAEPGRRGRPALPRHRIAGRSNRPVFAVRPGASGDISLAKGEEHNAFVAWFHPRASAYTSSPLVYRGRMYVVNDNGILTVFDAATGKEIYKARAGGSGNTFSASPWAADGQDLSAQRGRPHVRDRSRRQLRRAREEQPGRDEPGLAGARAGHDLPADADEALSDWPIATAAESKFGSGELFLQHLHGLLDLHIAALILAARRRRCCCPTARRSCRRRTR